MAPKGPARLVITFSGTLPGGDVFATSFAEEYLGGPPVTDDDAVAFRDNPPTQNFLTAMATLMGNTSRITDITLRSYPQPNQVASGVGHAGVGVAGTGPGFLPNQCALVLTIRTAVNTARGRGRMYLPCTGARVAGATGRVSDVDREALVTAAAAMFSVGRGGVASVSDSQFRLATRVEVGDVIDTVRARRDALRENRTSKLVPAP